MAFARLYECDLRHKKLGYMVEILKNTCFRFFVGYISGRKNINSHFTGDAGKGFAMKGKKNVGVYKKQYGLKKLVGKAPEILILGTLPGEGSIDKKEYYSGLANRFWEFVFATQTNVDLKKLSYKDKVKRLDECHIALWDIYEYAERKDGSSFDCDINLVPEAYKYNDVFGLLRQNPSIKMIVLCGVSKDTRKLYSKFLEFYKDDVFAALKNGVSIIYLPSASGSNRMNREKVEKAWLKVLP